MKRLDALIGKEIPKSHIVAMAEGGATLAPQCDCRWRRGQGVRPDASRDQRILLLLEKGESKRKEDFT